VTPGPPVPAPSRADVVVVVPLGTERLLREAGAAGSPPPGVVAYWFDAAGCGRHRPGTRSARRVGPARLLRRRAGGGGAAGRRVAC
jgi:hypothetical protein